MDTRSYVLNECVDSGLSDMIVVTGIFRSGTTITGKLVATLKGAEYAYDPPLLFHLSALARLGTVKTGELLSLMKVYLYYDYFLNYIYGRYNFRSVDNGSCVLNFKPYKEVIDRWVSVSSSLDAIAMKSEGHVRFAFKFCSLYKILEVLIQEYPSIAVVDVRRDLRRVVVSMAAKKWFFEESLKIDSSVMWPFYRRNGRIKVPYFVDEPDIDLWMNWNDFTRTAYMCCRYAEEKVQFRSNMNRSLNAVPKYWDLPYEDILANPFTVAEKLSRFTGMEWGAMTYSVLKSIQPTRPAFDYEESLGDCDLEVRERLEALNSALGY